MIELFLKGGPVMWPLLLASLIAVSVVFERILFSVMERARRDPAVVLSVLKAVENGQPNEACRIASQSGDFVARSLGAALSNHEEVFQNAMIEAARQELRPFNKGLTTLDTIVTLAPLLGLLGTVTGMIHSFRLLGDQELGSPAAITGGIAEALIATAFGLGIAITALVPFNYLNSQQEKAREDIESAATKLEILIHSVRQSSLP